jgi:MSHA biogenesis protein MshQ
VTSITDSITTFASSNVVFATWQKLTTASSWATGSTSVVTPPASVVFTSGAGSFKLSAPGSGKTGSVDMTTNTPTYLPNTTAGRATFGVYKGANEFIYLRENY